MCRTSNASNMAEVCCNLGHCSESGVSRMVEIFMLGVASYIVNKIVLKAVVASRA